MISRDSSVRIMNTPTQQEMAWWYSPGHKNHRVCLRSTEVHSSSYHEPTSALTHCMAHLCRGFSNTISRHLLNPVALASLNLASFLPKPVVSLGSRVKLCSLSYIWPALHWYRSDSFATDADIIWIFASVPLLCVSCSTCLAAFFCIPLVLET